MKYRQLSQLRWALRGLARRDACVDGCRWPIMRDCRGWIQSLVLMAPRLYLWDDTRWFPNKRRSGIMSLYARRQKRRHNSSRRTDIRRVCASGGSSACVFVYASGERMYCNAGPACLATQQGAALLAPVSPLFYFFSFHAREILNLSLRRWQPALLSFTQRGQKNMECFPKRRPVILSG